MTKLKLLIAAAFMPMLMSAQLAYWSIPAKYDSMSMVLDNAILQTDSAGITTIWTKDGQRLYSTDHKVNAYSENKAVVTDPANGTVFGYIDDKGKFVQLPGATVAYDLPEYSDGYLCVQTAKGYGYYKEGSDQSEFMFFEKAYPFSEGYAVYMAYKQPDKKKDAYYNYKHIDGKDVIYEIGGKKFEFRDIQFLSSVAPDGRAIAVIKDKVYWFDANTGRFSPMCGGGTDDKKNQVSVDGKVIDTFSTPTDNMSFKGKYGKNYIVDFTFDSQLRPETVIIDDHAITFRAKPEEPYAYQTPLTTKSANGKKGLDYNGNPILPAQFDDIALMYGDYAIAKIDGKWGLLKAMPAAEYSLIVNGGKDIGFRHETFDTQVRLDLPKEISSNDIDFDIPAASGCTLDKRFMDARDTRAGNFLQYNCVLTIPSNLPSELTEIVYPVTITYNGLYMYEYPIKVKAWHLKSYNVNVDEDEVTVQDGRATFTIDIEAQRIIGEPDYPFVVQAKADSLGITSEKISETRYKYTVNALKDGVNHIDIYVTEKGCPSAVFPIEITYVKPTKRTKEQVEVRKKDEVTVSEEPAESGDAEPAPAPAPVEQPTDNAVPAPAVNAETPAPAAVERQPGQESKDRYVPVPVQSEPQPQVPQPNQTEPTDSIKDANLLRFLM